VVGFESQEERERFDRGHSERSSAD
jgi:hypothetical protein